MSILIERIFGGLTDLNLCLATQFALIDVSETFVSTALTTKRAVHGVEFESLIERDPMAPSVFELWSPEQGSSAVEDILRPLKAFTTDALHPSIGISSHFIDHVHRLSESIRMAATKRPSSAAKKTKDLEARAMLLVAQVGSIWVSALAQWIRQSPEKFEPYARRYYEYIVRQLLPVRTDYLEDEFGPLDV